MARRRGRRRGTAAANVAPRGQLPGCVAVDERREGEGEWRPAAAEISAPRERPRRNVAAEAARRPRRSSPRAGMSPRTSGGEGEWTRPRDGRRDRRPARTAMGGRHCGRVVGRGEGCLTAISAPPAGPARTDAGGHHFLDKRSGRGERGPRHGRGRPRGYVAAYERWGGGVDAAVAWQRRSVPCTDGRGRMSLRTSGGEGGAPPAVTDEVAERPRRSCPARIARRLGRCCKTAMGRH